jgi:hypothetical protein
LAVFDIVELPDASGDQRLLFRSVARRHLTPDPIAHGTKTPDVDAVVAQLDEDCERQAPERSHRQLTAQRWVTNCSQFNFLTKRAFAMDSAA